MSGHYSRQTEDYEFQSPASPGPEETGDSLPSSYTRIRVEAEREEESLRYTIDRGEGDSDGWSAGEGRPGSQRGYFTAKENDDFCPPSSQQYLYDVDNNFQFGEPRRRRPSSSSRGGTWRTADNSSITPPPPPRSKHTCWNCKGDHMITDCSEPRDSQRIAQNRRAFMAAKNSFPQVGFGGRLSRYHQAPVQHNRPGHLSTELRRAMGLQDSEVPLHVYKMRRFGYPPGWLDNAMSESSSGLKLYVGDSVTTPIGSMRKDPKISADRIHIYPGYNAPMPFGVEDRGQEFGCPKFCPDDSIDNMIKLLEAKNLLAHGDGIVSQTSHSPPQWDSLSGIDRPVLNDGACHGIGRGRMIDMERLPRHLQPMPMQNEPRRENKLPLILERLDRDPRPRPPPRQPFRPTVAQQNTGIDSRYLPSQPVQPKASENRSNSPSLLHGDEEDDDFDPECLALLPPTTSNARVPVAAKRKQSSPVNPPLVPGTSHNQANDSDGGSTGSSNDFRAGPSKPKRKKVEKQKKKVEKTKETGNDDSDVMIISESSSSSSSSEGSTSDSSVLEDVPGPSRPAKSTSVRSFKRQPRNIATKSNQSTAGGKNTSKGKISSPEVVHLDSMDSEDWEKNTSKKRAPTPGSDTGDEESFMPQNNDSQPAPAPPPRSIYDYFDENWEDSNGSDKLVIDEDPGASAETSKEQQGNSAACDTAEAEQPRGEFIPESSEMQLYHQVLSALEAEEKEEQGNDNPEEAGSSRRSYSSLPPMEKFSQGLPPLELAPEAKQPTGVLNRVLNVLKQNRQTSSSPSGQKSSSS